MYTKYDCIVCGQSADGLYLFTEEIRKQLTSDPKCKQIICWDCVKRVLGRPVRSDDLKQTSACNERYIKLLKQLEKKQEETLSCET